MTDQNTNIQQLKKTKYPNLQKKETGKNSIIQKKSIHEHSHRIQWINGDFSMVKWKESWDIMNSPESIHVEEELADVMIYCLSLANQLDIDVATAIEEKIKKNGGVKYPASK